MPRTNRPPTYRLHKARNCTVVTLDGENHYLGPYGSPESHEKYARLIAPKHAAGGPTAVVLEPPASAEVSVNELILRYLNHASGYYVKNGRKTGEFDNIHCAVRSLKRLYSRTAAGEFRPQDLELVRQAMIQEDLARKTINGRIGRIKRMFRWGTREDLLPPGTYHALAAVEGLKRNRSAARETSPVATVPEGDVEKALAVVNPHVRAMARVQELAGMRPQDIRNLRTIDVDRTGDVWIYTPWTHKTEHHGHDRRIAIGPRAQAILGPFLNSDAPRANGIASGRPSLNELPGSSTRRMRTSWRSRGPA
jgi:integrase